ncbi:MAG: isoprenylcysteine carboxylmethyltransferase family protein, partial [Pirellulaceae bacterium]
RDIYVSAPSASLLCDIRDICVSSPSRFVSAKQVAKLSPCVSGHGKRLQIRQHGDTMEIWSKEAPYRLATLIVMLLTMLVTLRFRLRAAASGERISHEQEGFLFAAVLRLSGLALWVSTLLYLVYPLAVWWAGWPLPASMRWAAFVVGLSCAGLMYWTLSSLGTNLTDTVVTREQAFLVTHGPYRWVRHPFYFTAALVMASVTILSANTLIGLTSLVVLTMLAKRTRKEEQLLVARFGDAYREYMATTGRFWPRLPRRH